MSQEETFIRVKGSCLKISNLVTAYLALEKTREEDTLC